MIATDRHLHRVADDIDRYGIAGVEPDVDKVIARARLAGIEGVALEVLADRTEPAIARARAFGAVATQLASVPSCAPVAVTRDRAVAAVPVA